MLAYYLQLNIAGRYFNSILVQWEYVNRESYLRHLVNTRGVRERVTSF